MSHEPQIQTRAAQHYAAIPATVAMDGISAAVDDAFPALFGWLAAQGIAPAGPPLIRYLVIDGSRRGDLTRPGGVTSCRWAGPRRRLPASSRPRC